MLGATLASERAIRTEPIEGWRTWTLAGSRDGDDVHLLPIAGTGRPWPALRPIAAECARRRGHVVPGVECSCGVHATATTDPLRRTRDPAVLGRVALWGRIVEHARGYRAEYGYPQRLALLCQLCFWQRGATGSSAPIVVVRHRGGRMVPLCDEHLALCRRYDYPVPRTLEAPDVERALLSAYAVDVLRLSLVSAA